MRLLELFSGTGSVGEGFRERGWEVVSLDSNPKSEADIIIDIRDWGPSTFPPGISMPFGLPPAAPITLLPGSGLKRPGTSI